MATPCPLRATRIPLTGTHSYRQTGEVERANKQPGLRLSEKQFAVNRGQ